MILKQNAASNLIINDMCVKFYWICCLFLFFSMGCADEKKQVEMQDLHHEVLDIPEILIGSPVDIQKDGDCLIVLDYQHDSLFHRIDLKGNCYMGMFGTKGQGPDDFIYPSSLNVFGDGCFSCYDVGDRELNLICLDMNKVKVSKLLNYRKMMTFDVVPLSEKLFIVNGETDGAMFALVDKDGKVLSVSDEYPYKDDAEKSISSRFRAMAYQGSLRVNPNGYFAYAMSSAKQVHLYKVENEKIKKVGEVIDGYGHYEPNTRLGDGYGVAHDGKSPECYKDLAITDDYVYALYSGRTFQEYKMSAYDCETIYVYDWTGKLVKTYHLDVPVTQFCIDEEANVIYATANVPDPTIVRFELD